MHLWRYPSLSIHGIEGAFDEPGIKTVIPGRVAGKFSIRLVPHMNVSVVEGQVTTAQCHSAAPIASLSHHGMASNSVITEVTFYAQHKRTGTNVKKPLPVLLRENLFLNYMQLL